MDAIPEPGGGGGRGDGDGPRAFATGYRPHTGDMMVYGGGAMTIVGVLAAVVNAHPGFLIASLVGTASAFYFRPTLDLKSPQLGAGPEGVYVARIGIIRWDRMAEMRVEHHALRTMRLATLIIVPDGPLRDCLAERERVPLLERIQSRNARVRGGAVRVPLHPLAMPVDVIEARLDAMRALHRPRG